MIDLAALLAFTDFDVCRGVTADALIELTVMPMKADARIRFRSMREQWTKEHPADQSFEGLSLLEKSIHINYLQGIPQAFNVQMSVLGRRRRRNHRTVQLTEAGIVRPLSS